jgi:hypothetical protein
MPTQRFDVEIPEGHHLGYSRGTDGARRAHLFRDDTNELAGHAELFAVAEDEWRPRTSDYGDERVTPPVRPAEPNPQVVALIDAVFEWLTPYAEAAGARAGDALRTWWLDRAVPACKSTARTAWSKAMDRRKTGSQAEPLVPAAPVAYVSAPSSGEVAAPVPADGPLIGVSEAQLRLVAAALARALTDERLRLVLSAEFAGGDDLMPGANSLKTLTPEELEHRAHLLIEENPSLLDGFVETFLGVASTGAPVVPLEEAPPKLRLVAG